MIGESLIWTGSVYPMIEFEIPFAAPYGEGTWCERLSSTSLARACSIGISIRRFTLVTCGGVGFSTSAEDDDEALASLLQFTQQFRGAEEGHDGADDSMSAITRGSRGIVRGGDDVDFDADADGIMGGDADD